MRLKHPRLTITAISLDHWRHCRPISPELIIMGLIWKLFHWSLNPNFFQSKTFFRRVEAQRLTYLVMGWVSWEIWYDMRYHLIYAAAEHRAEQWLRRHSFQENLLFFASLLAKVNLHIGPGHRRQRRKMSHPQKTRTSIALSLISLWHQHTLG